MASKELFYDNRPIAGLNLRASRRIDPRYTFTRNSAAWAFDRDGIYKSVPANQLRHEHDPVTGEYIGPLVEPGRTNLFRNSSFTYTTPGNPNSSIINWNGWNPARFWPSATAKWLDGITPGLMHGADNQNAGGLSYITASGLDVSALYVVSIWARIVTSAELAEFTAVHGSLANDGVTRFAGTTFYGSVSDVGVSGTGSALLTTTSFTLTSRWQRFSWHVRTTNAGGLRVIFGSWPVASGGVQMFAAPQLERSDVFRPTSFIPTSTGSTVARAADLLSISNTFVPPTGTIFVDMRAAGAGSGNVIASLANASNEKITLGYESRSETYNSTALLAAYRGNVKATLPLPVPSTSRERHVFTWGANNYQHGFNTCRFATSLATSVPAGITRLGIGHDVVDPTKAFHGYINALYLWAGEMTPDVAAALVRSDLAAINADTYVPTGPAGSLSLIINTQGVSNSGDRVFTLPASRATVASTALVVGQQYRILTVGTTNWTLAGAASNTVGAVFVATGTTTGTGTAAWQNDFVVTWGDGTESGLEGTDAEGASAKLTKTYASAGIYPIWISDRLQDLIFNNSTSAPELVRIEAWGTGNMYRRPSTMANAFYGCSRLDFGTAARNPATFPDTSAVTSWVNAFRGCSSITGAFPAFNFSGATNFNYAFSGCSGITSWPAVDTQTQFVTNFDRAWEGCSGLTSFPLINTSAGTNFTLAWNGCSGLTSFPLINTGSATTLSGAWQLCTNLASFPLINTANVTNLSQAWNKCNNLASMPLINTSLATNMGGAWDSCLTLTSFPLINTSNVTNMEATWYLCSGLTSFPLINTEKVTNFRQAWAGATGLTSFPFINTGAGTNFDRTWNGCTGLTSVPAFNLANGTNLYGTFQGCTSLNTIPLFTLTNATTLSHFVADCSSITSLPLLVAPLCTNYSFMCRGCTSLTSFPAMNMNACVGLPSDVSPTTGFSSTWFGCTSLATFPPNMFNTTTCTRFISAFQNCALTAASIENILVSINTANTSNGNLSLQGGTNAGATTWTAPAVTAYNALIARGWTITRNA